MDIPLLRTKLYRPPAPADYVHRPLLLARLEKNSNQPLILVSAPAGYGKSTLVSCWLDACEKPSAWISLDESDNDLRQFLSYFVTALQSIFPESASEIEALIHAPNLPPLSILGVTLTNELDRINQDFVVVLDDIHRIHDKTVHGFLDFLLRHPAKPMQLVLIGRQDPILPIASLRARGMLTELRMADLRFTNEEAMKFLEAAMGRHIEKSTAEALAENTEGWVTGLRLAALAMQRHEGPEGTFLKLKGTTRYVMDYLMGEVLDGQSPGIRHCLLRTAILNRFSAPLCQVLCTPDYPSGDGGMDGHGFITFAQEHNLFMISLDTENRWFRYHHLFQNFLLSRLKRRCSEGEIAALHSRAGEWFESGGLITESIKHSLTAGDPAYAAEIIERHRDGEFTADRWHVVQRWLAMLPMDIRRKRPKLLLTEVWIGNLQHQLDRVLFLLDQAEPLRNAQTESPTVSGEFAFFRGYIAYFEGQAESSLRYLKDSTFRLAGSKSPFRGEAELMLGLARCMVDRKETAVQSLEALIRKVDPSEYYLLSRLIAGLAFIHQLWGDLNLLRVEAQHLRSVSHQHRLGLAEAWSYYFSGCAHLQAGEFEPASHHFAQAVKRRYVLEPRGALDAMTGLAMSQQFMGLDDEAEDSCRRLQEFAQELAERNYMSVAQSSQARLSLLRGELNSALEWGRSFGESPNTAELFSWLEAPSITQVRVLIAAGSRQDLLDAARSLEMIRELCKASRFPCQIIEVAVLQSIALEKLGRTDEASHAMEEAINLTRPGGWVRPFVEAGPPTKDLLKRLLKKDVAVSHIETILAALRDEKHVHVKGQTEEGPDASTGKPKSPSASVQSLVEPLTHREMDVLDLLIKRLQNKEIAEKLSISPLTVKSHLKSIYQKLSVEKRRQAVERAEELGILQH